jgi:hypothetical protein
MSENDRKISRTRAIAAISCGLLIAISLITFQQQIPTIAQTTKIYDKEYIGALKHVVGIIPQNETLATTENYPQVAYFTDHKVKVPSVRSERALVQFMWKVNSSYLLVSEDTSEPKPDNTPLLIQMAEKPFEIVSDSYREYISKLKSDNSPLLNTSEPKPDNTPLNLEKSIKGDLFGKLFEKILDYNTKEDILHLYHLRSNITRDNLSIVTDQTRPMLSISLPINGTIMQSNLGIVRLNVIGTAEDVDSNIKKVEVSINGLPFQLTNPRAPGDWSTWSFSGILTSEGTKRIVVRATDSADNRVRLPVYVTIK